MIFNSFKYSGMSNLLDGSKDDQFKEYEDIEKRNENIRIKMMIMLKALIRMNSHILKFSYKIIHI